MSGACEEQRRLRSLALKTRREFAYGRSLRHRIDRGAPDADQVWLSCWQRSYPQRFDSGAAAEEGDEATCEYGFGCLRGEQGPRWISWDTASQWRHSRHCNAASALQSQ